MSLESNLAKLVDVNTRIAVALEALAGAQGIVPGETIAEAAEAAAEPAKKAPAKKKAAKKTASKKAAGKKAAGKKPPKLTIKDDVRPVLKRLRDEVSHDAVKALLKKYGATTIQQLDEKDYAAVIADAQEDLE